MRRKHDMGIPASEPAAGRSLTSEVIHRFKKNRLGMIALFVLVVLVAIAIGTTVCDFVTKNAYYDELVVGQNLMLKLEKPNLNSLGNLFGRDEYGRSVFFRIIWGTRYSIFMGVTVILMATLIGGCIGSISATTAVRLTTSLCAVWIFFWRFLIFSLLLPLWPPWVPAL